MTKNTVAIKKFTKLDETTNPVERPITLILFSTNQNLTRTDLKKTFAVKKGKLFHARKENASVADVFDNLFAVRESRPAEGLFFNYKSKNPITHIYIVGQGTCVKEFAILKYGTQLLGGFEATTFELLEIKKLLEAYRVIALFCMEGKSALNRLHLAFPQFSRQILLSKSEWEKCKCKEPNTQLNSKKRQFAKLSTG
ncbi:hypothetical protein, partial [Limnohabitans sp. Hippo4]|uniref:hypothetical protein n=1 Tax=Limnohabitans sp. Hippo4 TaxID=1826167 RepID=UPI000DD286E2